ncbi:MAG: carboxypeptidase regulatory-like domain-containing protein [Myxococcales bacterium]|nr:carboxypeptidase regulatory-like domain-containing protein [Myxococcales bacterium]
MSPRPQTKLCLTVLIALLVSGACASTATRTAPFRARPDSTAPGKLEGPFSGQVKDHASGDPVPGALVYATWTYESGDGVAQPTGAAETVASTDANGRYTIAHPEQVAPGGRLTAFHLVLYKKGYVAYRSDRRFADLGPRFDFAQKHNAIRLERWHSKHSHVRHLRYIGGGSALAALTAWERAEASAELSGERGDAVGQLSSDLLDSLSGGRLIAAQLLGEAEIKEITDFDGTFESGPLNDEADTSTYSSQHFKALGQPEVFDVAIRLWRLEADGAAQRFTELSDTLPGVTERDDVADRSLLALEGDIQGYAFLDKQRSLVVLVTCGKGQCTTKSQLIAIASRIFSNIEAVVPLGQR